MDKLKMHTPNKADENFAKLAQLFPNAVTETTDENGEIVRAIDKDVLMQEISTVVVDGAEERYQFTWPDKKKSILLANAPIAKTLRPVRDDEEIPTGTDSSGKPYCSSGSVNFDTTENLYIEGDNLEVLKLLQETYLGKIKMIYIDPPYNTGNDFVYEDDFSMECGVWSEKSGDYDEDGNRLVKNLDSNGRFHTDWLNMMYPRLKLAKDLMTYNGIILINVDENEVTNLQKLCVEVFGEQNDLGTIIWDKRNPKGAVKGVSYQHEYILVYAKSVNDFAENCKMQRPKKSAKMMLDKAMQFFKKVSLTYSFEEANRDYARWVSQQADLTGGERAYNNFDKNGDVFRPVSMAAPDKPETRSHRPLIHPITGKPCPVPAKGWRFPDKSMDILLEKGEVLFGIDETTQPNRKYLLKENMYDNISSLLYYGGSDTDLLSNMNIPFETPKVVNIVKEHIQSMTVNDDIVLDFFSGSATTAHAVMQLNAEDGGNRKFIMVQLPEETDEKSEAYKAGYKNICEIGKERIRRAGQKILKEFSASEEFEVRSEKLKENNSTLHTPNSKLDIGFRVLKVDSTNMKDVYYNPADLVFSMFDSLTDNIKEDRTPEDLLFQVMLDLGVLLDSKIKESTIADKKVFNVADGFLIACFDENVTEETIKAIAQKKPYYFVMRDSSMANDSVATNFEQIFQSISPNTVRKIL